MWTRGILWAINGKSLTTFTYLNIAKSTYNPSCGKGRPCSHEDGTHGGQRVIKPMLSPTIASMVAVGLRESDKVAFSCGQEYWLEQDSNAQQESHTRKSQRQRKCEVSYSSGLDLRRHEINPITGGLRIGNRPINSWLARSSTHRVTVSRGDVELWRCFISKESGQELGILHFPCRQGSLRELREARTERAPCEMWDKVTPELSRCLRANTLELKTTANSCYNLSYFQRRTSGVLVKESFPPQVR